MKSSEPRKPLFERLRQGLNEGIQQARGELTLRTTVLPDRPPEISPEEVAALRAECGMSLVIFARVLGVSARTVQGWEQGSRKPSPPSRRLLQVFRENPALVLKAVGLDASRKPSRSKAGNGPAGPDDWT